VRFPDNLTLPAGADARFANYLGCNHERIPEPETLRFGGFFYSNHLGKPLTARLWEDLVERACVSSLWVLPIDGWQWCLGRGPGAATVYFDEQGLVKDIFLVPHFACWREHVSSGKPFVCQEELGAVTGHAAGLARVDFALPVPVVEEQRG
jgi:hypothetical protein